MIRIYCDHCNQEITGLRDTSSKLIITPNSKENNNLTLTTEMLICGTCSNKLEKYLKGERCCQHRKFCKNKS